MTTPDRFGVVLGYRTWRLESDPLTYPRYSLRGTNTSGPWTERFGWYIDRFTEASCIYSCPSPPSFDCVCGLYARYQPKNEPTVFYPQNLRISGAVLAWGKIIHHRNQSFFRSANMLPVAFMKVPSLMPPYVRAKAKEGTTEQAYADAVRKLELVSGALDAPIFSDAQALREYAIEEEGRWQ